MKLLAIPNGDISYFNSPNDGLIGSVKNWYLHNRFRHPTYESLYFSDLPIADVEVRVSFLGKVHPCYNSSSIPGSATNQSAYFDLDVWDALSYRSAKKHISEFHALLVSIEEWERCQELIIAARKAGKKIAVIDHAEHPEAFKASEQVLTRGLQVGTDCDIYFKNHLPVGRRTKRILPLAPTPVRPERFNFIYKPITERPVYATFSGIVGKSETYLNRVSLLEVFQQDPRTKISVVELSDHYEQKLPLTDEYNRELSNSRFSLSPAGRCWQTTRHVISGLAGCVPIMPYPDVETVDFEARHLKNGVFYPMLITLSEDQRRAVAKQVASECQQLDSDQARMQHIADEWQQQIFSKHTTQARARYILSAIKDLLH